jgi:hypothetical protein
MVSLRLSEVEYQGLVDLCATYDAHSTSDLARIAVSRFLRDHGNHAGHSRLSEFELQEKVGRLEDELQRLSRMLNPKALAAKG